MRVCFFFVFFLCIFSFLGTRDISFLLFFSFFPLTRIIIMFDYLLFFSFFVRFQYFFLFCARIIGRKKITDKSTRGRVFVCVCICMRVFFFLRLSKLWSLELHEENITCNVCMYVLRVCSRLL